MSSSFTLRSASEHHRHSVVLALLALVLFAIGNYHQSVIGFDSRFVLFAQEMLRHGPGLFPTSYGEPYPDYSATSTFFIYLLSLPFGQVSSLTAWLPTAIASAVVVMLMYRLLAPYSRHWALASIALMLLSVTFVTETRAVSLDQMLAAVAFSVFYLAYAADHFGASRRLVAVFALLVLGFAIRGPIGLVIPTGMLCSYYLLTGQWKRMFGVGFAALALLGLCIGLLLWAADVSGGASFVQDVIRMQVTGRIDGSEGSSGVLYYFTSSLGNYALAYPLALLALICVLVAGRDERGPALTLLGLCVAAGLIVMIGLSIPMAKKARYILPMLPMAAIAAAYPFQASQGRAFVFLRGLIQGLWLIMPTLLIAGLLVIRHKFAERMGSVSGVIGLLVVLQAVALAFMFKFRAARIPGLAGCAVLALWGAYILVFEPVERQMYDTRSLTQSVQQATQANPAPLVLYGMGKDAKAIKFVVNIDEDLLPVFADTPEQLTALPGPVWILLSKADYRKLPVTSGTPVLGGMFDKDDYMLLRRDH